MNRYCLALTLIVAVGCAKRENPTVSAFEERDCDYVLAVVIDLSGSFSQLMADDGKAHEFLLYVLDQYFRDRIGSQDKVLLAQISGGTQSLLWEGTPTQLRREFSTPAHFREFLLAKADPGGSLVHEALADTLEYMIAEPSVVAGRAKPAILVLSDMLDTGEKSPQMRQRVVGSLAKFSQLGGVVGLYFVDERWHAAWRRILRESGMRECVVESQIVSRPTLPRFE
jgi:hypothetical protein